MKNKKIIKIIKIIVLILVVFSSATFIYASSYYRSAEEIKDFLDEPYQDIVIEIGDKDEIIFKPIESNDIGIIFYQGGKVEQSAYSILLGKLASKGITCILLKSPLNLAICDINGSMKIDLDEYNISQWYLAGHSLGATTSSICASKHLDKFSGLIFLAGYCSADLSNTNLKILSIYGSSDQVLNQDEYQKAKSLCPSNFVEYVIEGANHSGFGNYGLQKGDGIATISCEEQQNKTTDIIVEWLTSR